MLKKIIYFCAVSFGLSLGFIHDRFGSTWYNLYISLAAVILTIALFWKKTAWMLIMSLISIVFLFIIDHWFADDSFMNYIKILYILSLVPVGYVINGEWR